MDIIEINILQFSLVYLLLIIVSIIMKICKVNQLKLLIVGSVRMSVQLVLAGFILTYIFENPHPLFVISYIAIMIGFTIHRILSKNKNINKQFKIRIALSILISSISILAFFIVVVLNIKTFNPQYIIPISGMLLGNSMTGVSIAVKTFTDNLEGKQIKINTLLSIGVKPKVILLPFIRKSFETAMLPTLNSMVSMGIVALPGMMTGQILSGVSPNTAILYQIAIMIAICTIVCLTSFLSLYFGSKTLYNNEDGVIIM